MNDSPTGLLLDTHAIIWLMLGTLDAGAAERISRAASAGEVFVSPVSAWEIGLLARPGQREDRRLSFAPDPLTWFERALATGSFRLAAFDPAIAIGASFLPDGLHKDPADRLLVATARKLDLTLMTRDRHILSYARAGHVQAETC